MSADSVASQVEAVGMLKGAAGSVGYGGAVYAVAENSVVETAVIASVDPSIYVHLGVAVIIGIYHLILIYEKLKK